MDRPTSILVVEDEDDMREGLRHNLDIEGFCVTTAIHGADALARLPDARPDLILLDLMMPEMDGLTFLRELRINGHNTPVIILSAKGQDQDVVRGLELGADDYMAKPFGLAELVARIRAVLRRTLAEANRSPRRYEFPDLLVDFRRFTTMIDGVEHQLSKFEADILRMLIDHQGEVVSRKDLLTKVWGYVHLPTTRTVDNHIARLRKKVERVPEQPTHVVTVHGLGYRFEPTPVRVE